MNALAWLCTLQLYLSPTHAKHGPNSLSTPILLIISVNNDQFRIRKNIRRNDVEKRLFFNENFLSNPNQLARSDVELWGRRRLVWFHHERRMVPHRWVSTTMILLKKWTIFLLLYVALLCFIFNIWLWLPYDVFQILPRSFMCIESENECNFFPLFFYDSQEIMSTRCLYRIFFFFSSV